MNVNSTPENKTKKQKFNLPSVFNNVIRFFTVGTGVEPPPVALSPSLVLFSGDTSGCPFDPVIRVSGSAKMRKAVSATSNNKVRRAGAA